MLDDVLAVEHFLEHLVVWPLLLEKLIVHLTASSWINSDEVASTLVFQSRFPYVLLISQTSRLLQRLEQARILYWVLVYVLVDGRLQLRCRLASENLGARQANQATSG